MSGARVLATDGKSSSCHITHNTTNDIIWRRSKDNNCNRDTNTNNYNRKTKSSGTATSSRAAALPVCRQTVCDCAAHASALRICARRATHTPGYATSSRASPTVDADARVRWGGQAHDRMTWEHAAHDTARRSVARHHTRPSRAVCAHASGGSCAYQI